MPNKDNEADFRKAHIYLLDSTLGGSSIFMALKDSKNKGLNQIRYYRAII
jgi:hypothetical protein